MKCLEKNRYKIAIIILLLLPGLAIAGDYRCDKVGTGSGYGEVIVAPGRNDGVNRVYASGEFPYEYTWDGNIWIKDSLTTTPSWIISIAAGFGRNDSVCAIYTGDQIGSQLWEYIYDTLNNIWNGVKVDDRSGLRLNAVEIGNVKNDDTMRVVAGGSDSATIAYTYQEGTNTWEKDTVGVKRERIFQIEIGKGHNDDSNRIYSAGDGFWCEYTFRNKWDSLLFVSGSYGVTLSKLKSDSLARLYLSSGGITEYTWDGFKWGITDTVYCLYITNVLIEGNGRNDAKQRIYSGVRGNTPIDSIYAKVFTHEYSYSVGTGWEIKELSAVIWNPDGYPRHSIEGVAIGKGRNDDTNRVYGLCTNGELFEWTWDDTINGVWQEEVKVGNDINIRKVLKVKPNPFYSYTAITNLPSDVELKIYDITGRLVEKTTSHKVGAGLKAGVYFVTAGDYKPAKAVKIK